MGLKLYNQRPQSEFLTGLYLTPVAHVKTCAASIGGGIVSAEIAYTAFNIVAIPVVFVAGITAISFLSAVDIIHDKMIARAMKNGDVTVRSHRRPKIVFD